jgi:ribosomal protein S4E
MDLKRALDYMENDLVQITHGKHAGELAVITEIRLSRKQNGLIYQVMTSGGDMARLSGMHIRFLRHADGKEK